MSFTEILYSLLIGPLQLLFEVIFSCANKITNHPGLTIISLSLSMNFLILPLYMRADALQEEERDIQMKLAKGVAHIKKTFKGDERMMMLQTYYRQNNYKPTYVLRGAMSLFLEIPFFIAAYQFLSHLTLLQGVSFGPIADLGKEDGLIVIGGIAINLLPILMTAINAVSTYIFTKGFPLKTKIQLYAMALFFLVFLYTSPSGLVFYWTLNNLFSLVKTIFYKLKNPKLVLSVIGAVTGVIITVFGFRYRAVSTSRFALFVLVGIALVIPLGLYIFRRKRSIEPGNVNEKLPSGKLFLVCALFLTVLQGLLIPSAVIKTSPLEFVNIAAYYNPIWYVVSALTLSAGAYLVWFNVFYRLSQNSGKLIMEHIFCIYAVISVADYMLFGKNLGTLFSTLKYENGLVFGAREKVLNLAVVVIIAVIVAILLKYKDKIAGDILLICVLAFTVMSIVNIAGINSAVEPIKQQAENGSDRAEFSLSKNGKNVVVLMLDRAMGEYVPYLMSERPELMEKYDGFTYYESTLSYGGHTNFATPALFGGYEYMPEKINERADEALVDKQNEALKVLPVLFDESDFAVTVCDPPYAGYQEIPDISIYDDYPRINKYITNGTYEDESQTKSRRDSLNRNFFCYSLVKSVPALLQGTLYENGNYHNLSNAKGYNSENQIVQGLTKADGFNNDFSKAYPVLENLSAMTDISEDASNNFLMMANDTTHTEALLQRPDYVPMAHVDNSDYSEEDRHADASVFAEFADRTLKVTDWENQVMLYHANMAALLRIADWLDYLRENGVYDNTRIILVSDHGFGLGQIEELIPYFDGQTATDLEYYFPLLMVKDFNATGFTVSDEFMTNADVPVLATNGIIDNPKNPFTGNDINSDAKNNEIQYVISSETWKIQENNGNVFEPATWLGVNTEDIWNMYKWGIAAENAISPINNQ